MNPAFRAAFACIVLVTVAIADMVAAAPAMAEPTFGGPPHDDVRAAARTYHDDCSTTANRLTVPQLVALVLAPTFGETGAPDTESPSPMTLSRYDLQESLHSYGSSDNWRRAFWHPGVGAWQWDDASAVGLTAAERIRTGVVADHTTAVIAARWCNSPSFSTVWAPWYACNPSNGQSPCREAYTRIRAGELDRDVDVGSRGGMSRHQCVRGTLARRFSCWFVDPARARGFDGFAVPEWGRSPVTTPFLNWGTATHQRRLWLMGDSGYGRHISASLRRGLDSRGNLTWGRGTKVCDFTRRVGPCDPMPTSGARMEVRQITRSQHPVSGDFDGDGHGDIIWHGRGSVPDSIWWGRTQGFRKRSLHIAGSYRPVAGDFNGDGRDDVLWHGPGTDRDRLWWGGRDRFDKTRLAVRGRYRPVAGDFDGDGFDDILWYGRHLDNDWLWSGRPSGFRARRVRIPYIVRLAVGDFDGDGRDDLLLHGRGSRVDQVWYGTRRRTSFQVLELTRDAAYRPFVADFGGDGRDDIVWYAPDGADAIWRGTPGRGFRGVRPFPSIRGDYRVVTGDFNGDGRGDAFLHRPGVAMDAVWWGTGR